MYLVQTYRHFTFDAFTLSCVTPARLCTRTHTNATDSRLEGLRALRAWFDDWSETARTVVARRDYLIRLGLAKRKKSVTPAKPESNAPTTP